MRKELNLKEFLEYNGGLEEYLRALLDGAINRESTPNFLECPVYWIWWDLEVPSENGYSLYRLSEFCCEWKEQVREAEEEGRPVVPGMPLMDDLGLAVMLAGLEESK